MSTGAKEQTLRLLEDLGPMTTEELARLRQVSRNAALKVLISMHRAGAVRVHGWRRPEWRGNYAAVWAAGAGGDAPRPALHASRQPR